MGIPKILKHPWGYGVGQGAVTLNFQPFGYITIDSYWLNLLLEYGIVGTGVYAAFFISGLWEIAKSVLIREPLDDDRGFLIPIGVAVANFLIIKTAFAQQDNHSLLFVMMGAIVAIRSRQPVATAQPATLPARSPEAIRQTGAALPALR